MRSTTSMVVAALAAVALSVPVAAQTYEVTWHTVDGGGVMNATGGAYEASCTIGQPDAEVTTGGSYTVTGGFWSFGLACYVSSPAEPERLELPFDPISRKIRYLSFEAQDVGRSGFVRVTFVDLPAPYDTWNGVQMFVQTPQVYCENGGVAQVDPCPASVGGLASVDFLASTLACEPPEAYDWASAGLVHVFHEGIVPGGEYDIQVIDGTCALAIEGNYSPALTLTQSDWADLIQDCTTTPCKPPDGSTGIVDVTAILDKWKNLPGNVKKIRADIEGSPAGDHRIPDQAINITDVTYCLGAFLGDTYPGPGFPSPSLPPVCP